ncbi:MAG: hypothetical protein IKG40_00485 [Bacilli bacterium]|nr:hypothetical protein [Bacilli bacterium]
METINYKELISFFISKIYLVILFVLIFTGLGYLYFAHVQTPLYQSSTNVILVSEQKENTTQSDLNMNHQLVSTYSEIIKNNSVLDKVIKNLNLNTTSEKLAKKIKVSAVNNTEIIKIEVLDKSPKQAYIIVNEVTDTFIKKVNEVFSLENVEILSKAKIAKEPYNIDLSKQLILSAAGGILISFIVIFLIYYFDTTIKNVEDIEKLGLTALGKVVKAGGKNEKK